ncbi:hypothetical protein [Paraburkholderia phenoliruptrix]|uniref:hypothetical protein n=1 Tax=Paraburkholderia phenoliruptrix TaxID=252970 RepID=UPI0034CE58BD
MISDNSICAPVARTATRFAAWRRVVGNALAHAHTHQLLDPFRVQQGLNRPISVHADIELLGRRFGLSIFRFLAGETNLQLLDSNRRRGGIVAMACVDLITRGGTVIARVPETLQAPRFSGWSREDVAAIFEQCPEPIETGFQWSDLRALRAVSALGINGAPIGAPKIVGATAVEGNHARR